MFALEDTELFEEHDSAWLFTPVVDTALGKKLSTFWSGPWRIVRKVNPVVFEITSEGDWNSKQLRVTAAIDRLKKYYGAVRPVGVQRNLENADFVLADEFAEMPSDESAVLQEKEKFSYSTANVESKVLQGSQRSVNPTGDYAPSSSNEYVFSPNRSQIHAYDAVSEQQSIKRHIRPQNTSFGSATPLKSQQSEHEANITFPTEHGTFRKSLRLQGRQPQFLGVEAKNKPIVNPDFDEQQ